MPVTMSQKTQDLNSREIFFELVAGEPICGEAGPRHDNENGKATAGS